jgi:hypothetical protein
MSASDDDPPIVSSVGTDFQSVMSLSEESGSHIMVPAGRSGHPPSRFHKDLASGWLQGENLLISMDLPLARGARSERLDRRRYSPIPRNGYNTGANDQVSHTL